MSVRTSASAVQAVLVNDYNGTTSLTAYIEAASSIVDRLAALDADGVLPVAQLELIERWLAAHSYCLMDRTLASKTTGKSSGVFHGKTGLALDFTPYGQMAKQLDWTGKLESLGKAQPKMAWLGKPVSNQTAYEDRD